MVMAVTVVAAAAPAGETTVIPFRTEVAPRVDPVFGDVARLRAGIDRFLALQGEMDQVRTEFSATVNGTLTRLGAASGGTGGAAASKAAARVCPAGAMAQYGRALAAGGRYLGLGRLLEVRYREIRRAEELGEAAGLTPDYRIKMKRARELYLELLRDYREMRVAFYEQLGAEMRHAGCALRAPAADGPDPSNAQAWQLEDPSPPPEPEAAAPTSTGRPAIPAAPAPPAGSAAPAIWIAVDNSHCPQRSHLSIDGTRVGTVAERQKLTVRTRAGPHEVCVLAATDKRACGDPGTVRRAYLYDGWTLVVRCEGK